MNVRPTLNLPTTARNYNVASVDQPTCLPATPPTATASPSQPPAAPQAQPAGSGSGMPANQWLALGGFLTGMAACAASVLCPPLLPVGIGLCFGSVIGGAISSQGNGSNGSNASQNGTSGTNSAPASPTGGSATSAADCATTPAASPATGSGASSDATQTGSAVSEVKRASQEARAIRDLFIAEFGRRPTLDEMKYYRAELAQGASLADIADEMETLGAPDLSADASTSDGGDTAPTPAPSPAEPTGGAAAICSASTTDAVLSPDSLSDIPDIVAGNSSRVVSNNSASVVSNNGASLISNNGANLISNNGANVMVSVDM